MPVSAAQLSAVVKVDGVDTAKNTLNDFASYISDMTSSLSSTFGNIFSGLANAPSLDMSSVTAASSDLAELGTESEALGEKLLETESKTGSFKDSLTMISSSLQQLGSNIGGVVMGRLSNLASSIQQVASNIATAVSGPINSFIGKIQDLATKISDAVSGPINSFIDKVQNVYTSAINTASNTIQSFTTNIATVGSIISDAVSGPINAFIDGVQNFASAISNTASSAFNNFTNGIQQIASNISDAVSGPINNFTSGIQRIGSNISDAISGPLNNFTSGVQQVGSKISDTVSGPFNAFTNSIKSFASDIGEAASGPLADLISGIKSLGSNISEAASGPLNTLSGGVKSVFSGVQSIAQRAMDSIKGAFTNAIPSIGDFVGGIKKATSGFLGFTGSILQSTGIMQAFTNPMAFLQNQLSSTIQIAEKHQNVMAQTAAVIQSTGDASGMTAQSIGDLATSLSKVTPFSEDTIQSGENLLLTFKGIGKDVFPQTTQTMLDMAQAMGGDTKSAALQLGKALDDPAKGMTALTRVGVTFSDKQKELIQHLVAVGDKAGAQKIILQELQSEFGKSAEKAGQTFGGQLQILQNNLEDTKQKIGTALLPILSQLTSNVTSMVMPAINGFANFLQSPAFQSFASGVGKAISDAFTSIGNVLKTIDWKTFGNDFSYLGQQLGPIITGLKPPNNNLFKDIGGVVKNVIKDVGDFAKHLGDVVKWFKDGGAPATVLKDAIIGVGIAIGLMKIGQFVAALPGMIAGIWGWATAQGGVAVATLLTALPYIAIGALVVGIIALIVLAVQHWGDIVKWLTGVWSAVAGFFEWLWGQIAGFFVGVGQWFADRFNEAKNAVVGAFGAIGQWFGDRWHDIQNAFGAAGKWFQDLWQGIVDDFNSILGGLGDLAGNIWNGITDAVKAGFNFVIDLINNVIKTVDNIKVGGFGINIPLIPHLASGGLIASAGVALVGEQGPELVQLPAGARVIPNSQLGSASSGGSAPIIHIHNYIDGKEMSDTVGPRIIKTTRTSGPIRSNI